MSTSLSSKYKISKEKFHPNDILAARDYALAAKNPNMPAIRVKPGPKVDGMWYNMECLKKDDNGEWNYLPLKMLVWKVPVTFGTKPFDERGQIKAITTQFSADVTFEYKVNGVKTVQRLGEAVKYVGSAYTSLVTRGMRDGLLKGATEVMIPTDDVDEMGNFIQKKAQSFAKIVPLIKPGKPVKDAKAGEKYGDSWGVKVPMKTKVAPGAPKVAAGKGAKEPDNAANFKDSVFAVEVLDHTKPIPRNSKDFKADAPAFYPYLVNDVVVNNETAHVVFTRGSSVSGVINMSSPTISAMGHSVSAKWDYIIVETGAGMGPKATNDFESQEDDDAISGAVASLTVGESDVGSANGGKSAPAAATGTGEESLNLDGFSSGQFDGL